MASAFPLDADNILDFSDTNFNGADNKNYIGSPSTGGWGWGESANKKIKCLNPTGYVLYVVSCFKQTSRGLLELSKIVFLSSNELIFLK